MALVVLLLGLAALNRFRLTPALARDPSNTRPLVRSILAECIVVVAILARRRGLALHAAAARACRSRRTPLAIHIHAEQAMFQVLMSPGKGRRRQFRAAADDGDGSPLTAKEATLILSLPERGIAPLERKASLGADGYWHVNDVPMPYPGRWHVRIEP